MSKMDSKIYLVVFLLFLMQLSVQAVFAQSFFLNSSDNRGYTNSAYTGSLSPDDFKSQINAIRQKDHESFKESLKEKLAQTPSPAAFLAHVPTTGSENNYTAETSSTPYSQEAAPTPTPVAQPTPVQQPQVYTGFQGATQPQNPAPESSGGGGWNIKY